MFLFPAPASSSWEGPDPMIYPPEILFRVECHEKNPNSFHFTLGERIVISGRADLPVSAAAADECLTRTSLATPFVEFTSKWEKAMAKRKKLIDEGKKEIAIVPVYTIGLENVYDAYEVAKWLGYEDGGPDTKRQLWKHVDEYLIFHGILEEQRWRILTNFHGLKDMHVKLSVRGIEGSATVPDCLSNVEGVTIEQKLETLISSNTGVEGDSPQLFYLVLAMIGALDLPHISFRHEYNRSE